jgi:hypothetical protein
MSMIVESCCALALRCAARQPPPRHAKRASGTPGLRRKEGISSFAFPALALQLAKLASGPCRATTIRPAARDWIWMRRAVWNPTLRKEREGAGPPRYCS